MILFPQDLKANKQLLGGKTLSLGILLEYGFDVPDFVAIPSNVIEKIIKSDGKIDDLLVDQLSREIISKFSCDKYAVRSSALAEDSKEKSYAGQFTTKIDRSKEQLAEAITEVVKQAYGYLNGKLDKFSILIQRYIQADYAGVTFTRNPLGGREMVVEFVKGKGEDLVSGTKTAKKIKFYWHQNGTMEILPGLTVAIENFKKIEKIFDFPQDIEWCIKGNRWHFVQSRPITTLTEKDVSGYEFLDEHLPKTSEYIFEKTEISEIAERPTEITKSILSLIYAKDGPIDKVYKKHRIKYLADNFLEIIGNELYVNREKEIKTLLPAYTYLKKDFSPKLSDIKGLFTTILNIFRLNKIPFKNLRLKEHILSRLGDVLPEDEALNDRINGFLTDYQLIFEINLLTDKAFKFLTNVVKKYSVSCADLLVNYHEFPGINISKFKGNSLEISDESQFSITKSRKSTVNPDWLEKISKYKHEYIRQTIATAQQFSELREYGRWLTVKHVSHIRKKVLTMAVNKKFTDPKNIYFATLNELKTDTYTENKCAERKQNYLRYNIHSFPSKLISRHIEEENPLLGISSGMAEGQLVNAENISNADETGKKILYTKSLSPNLVEYFPKITGILSENGSLLSHLAIMARENNIPAIANFRLGGSAKLGDYLQIDGAKGLIYKKKES